MYKGSTGYKLNQVLTIIHILLIVSAGIVGFMAGYVPIPFAYLIVFFINEYTFNTYNDASDSREIGSKKKSAKAKASRWYMYSSASLIIWMVFMIFLPNIVEESWTPTGNLWASLYLVFIMFAAVGLALLNWVRKITSA